MNTLLVFAPTSGRQHQRVAFEDEATPRPGVHEGSGVDALGEPDESAETRVFARQTVHGPLPRGHRGPDLAATEMVHRPAQPNDSRRHLAHAGGFDGDGASGVVRPGVRQPAHNLAATAVVHRDGTEPSAASRATAHPSSAAGGLGAGAGEAGAADTVPEPALGAALGNYRVVRSIGAGGMGTVYEAEHTHLERRVAIKVMHPELRDNEEIRRRFLGEAVSIARLSHPGVVKIFDFGDEPGGAAYLIMEYLDGQSLGDALAQGPLPLARALDLGRQIASTLAATHRAGIVHRDIKPDNVHLVRDRYTGQDLVKLLDFGVAKFEGNDLVNSVRTQAGKVIGTPLYMSPEQCLGAAVDARSDVYGLGCLLYHMVCGQPPFQGKMADILVAHCKAAPAPPRALRPEIPVALESLILHMLDKRAARRPRRMEDVAAGLRAIQRELGTTSGEHAPVWGTLTAVVAPAPKTTPARPSRLRRALWVALLSLAALAL